MTLKLACGCVLVICPWDMRDIEFHRDFAPCSAHSNLDDETELVQFMQALFPNVVDAEFGYAWRAK